MLFALVFQGQRLPSYLTFYDSFSLIDEYISVLRFLQFSSSPPPIFLSLQVVLRFYTFTPLETIKTNLKQNEKNVLTNSRTQENVNSPF